MLERRILRVDRLVGHQGMLEICINKSGLRSAKSVFQTPPGARAFDWRPDPFGRVGSLKRLGLVVHSDTAGRGEIVPDCDNIQSEDGRDQAAICEDPQAAICEDPYLCGPAGSFAAKRSAVGLDLNRRLEAQAAASWKQVPPTDVSSSPVRGDVPNGCEERDH
jgi:hypothetical protein